MSVDKSIITQVKLNDGTVVGINDHIYLSPEHLGEPYYIGRVMEFCKVPNRKGLQVRVANYSRPKDIFNLKSYDATLSIATMNSELNPVSSIRGKCKVVHKHYIPKDQFEQYKAKEDRFYYTHLYDRYMQRVYDLLPCDLIQNVPMDVQEALCQRYQFIVVEQGKAADLTGARRTCCECQTWCNSTSSVKCAGCQKNFHMSCVSPPLTRKPSKGFAWQCAFCSKKETEDLSVSSPGPESQSSTTRTPSPEPGKRAVRLRSLQQQQQEQQQQKKQQKALLKQKQQQAKKEKEKRLLEPSSSSKIFEDPSQVRTTHMWPFRYFGVNTNIKDILDIDDRIYPRATSRIGSKYQATVPDWKDPLDHALPSSSLTLTPKERMRRSSSSISPSSQSASIDDSLYEEQSSQNKRRGKASKRKETSPLNDDNLPDVGDESTMTRGTSHTVTAVFSEPDRLKDEQLDDYISKVQVLPTLPLAPHSADTYDLALSILEGSDYNIKVALEKIQRVTRDDFSFLVTWQPDEIKKFEQGIQDHGHELVFVKQGVPTKSMADIVRFFYKWKKSDRYEPVYSVWTKVFKPTKQFKKNTRSILDCLGKHQEDDLSIRTAFSLQQQERNFFSNTKGDDGKKRGMSTTTTTTETNGIFDTSGKNQVDDDDDKDSRLSQPHQHSDPEVQPVRVTRRSTSLARQTTTIKKEPNAGHRNTIMDRKLKDRNSVDRYDSSDDDNDDDDIPVEMMDDPSVIPFVAISKKIEPIECHNCSTTQSTIWRRVPGDTDRKQKMFDRALCNDCGKHWLKYGKKRPVTSQTLEANGVSANVKMRGRAMKRKHSQYDDDLDGSTSKKPKEDRVSVKTPMLPCQVCYSLSQPKRLISCADCGLMVHYDCFGVDENDKDHWRCDVCKNKTKPTVSGFYQCTLCFNDPAEKQHAMKATSGYNWCHVTCALFAPEVKFICPSTMSPIEYVGSVANTKRKEVCKICTSTGVGNYLTCSDENCTVKVHAQCAVKHGYQAGFTVETPTSNGPSTEPMVELRLFDRASPYGVMIPRIYCPDHLIPSSQHFYAMNTRSQMSKSWISIYSELYKQIGPNTTPAMRRYFSWCQRNNLSLPNYYKHTLPSTSIVRTNDKRTLTTKSDNSFLSALLNPSCSQCPVTSSPYWWTMDDLGTENFDFVGKLCQRCYCKYQRQAQQS